MEKLTRKQFKIILESYIDSHCLFDVRQLITEICFEKSEHVRASWPNESRLAATWDRLGEIYNSFDELLTDTPKSLEQKGNI